MCISIILNDTVWYWRAVLSFVSCCGWAVHKVQERLQSLKYLLLLRSSLAIGRVVKSSSWWLSKNLGAVAFSVSTEVGWVRDETSQSWNIWGLFIFVGLFVLFRFAFLFTVPFPKWLWILQNVILRRTYSGLFNSQKTPQKYQCVNKYAITLCRHM